MNREEIRALRSIAAAKSWEWLKRYAPLEIASVVTALIGGFIASQLGAAALVVAYVAAVSENVGYYGVAFMRELRHPPDAAASDQPPRALAGIKNLLWEFGIAEVLDGVFVRPFAIWGAMAMTGSTAWGIVIGKIVADVFFYAIAITIYEWRKARQ